MSKCPYCDSDSLGIVNIMGESFAVGCKNCGMTGPQSRTEEGAREAWEGLCARICRNCISRPWGKAMARRIARLAKDQSPETPVTE